MSYYPEWRHKQIIAAIVAAGFAVDFALRRYFIDAVGMTPVEFVGGLVAGKYVANAAVLPFLDKQEREDWYYAESEIYSWGGFENVGYFQFLNIVPSPYGLPKILFESGMMLGEASLGVGFHPVQYHHMFTYRDLIQYGREVRP